MSSSSERSGSCRKVGLVRMKVVAGRQEIAGGQEWQEGKKHKKERQAGVGGAGAGVQAI